MIKKDYVFCIALESRIIDIEQKLALTKSCCPLILRELCKILKNMKDWPIKKLLYQTAYDLDRLQYII